MTENHIVYGFTAGEVSPEFYARTDLTKYGLGVGIAKNFFLDYKGGMLSRQGSRLVGQVLDDTGDVRCFRFRASGTDYVLIFGHLNMRVVRSGGYILESGTTISGITNANPAVVTDTGHPYSDGDWIFVQDVVGMTEVNGRYFIVNNSGVNDYELQDLNGVDIDSLAYIAYASAGTSSRVYTLTTTYDEADLDNIRMHQDKTVMTITHLNYSPRSLTYVTDTNWTLADITYGNTIAQPTNLTYASNGTPILAGALYAVTAVDQDGQEGQPSDYLFADAIVNFTQVEGSVRINWDVVPEAAEYFVYRSVVNTATADTSASQEVGFIGRCRGTQFVDANIIADFTKTPPLHLNPFAHQAITYIEITAGGSGYTSASVVSIGGPGSGFIGYPLINSSGAATGVIIVNGGEGYSAPTLTIGTPGTGATGTFTVSAATNNNPRVYTLFQQRGVYAGTRNNPMLVSGSKPGAATNFDISTIVNPGDAYNYQLDQQSVIAIRHLIALRTGLLTFTNISIDRLAAEEGKAVTPLSALAQTQAYFGANNVVPIKIGLDILFTQAILGNMNALSFTEYTNTYAMQDLSILSSHLFGTGKLITRMTYAEQPHKLIYSVREDGSRLLFTYLREQEVFAWTQDETKGSYLDNVSIFESGENIVYQIVERTLAGGTHRYIERIQTRAVDHSEDTWAVDCGLDFTLSVLAESITPAAYTGTDINFALSGTPTGISIGDILYVGGGKVEVTALPGGSALTGKWLRDMTDVQKEDANNTPLTQASGDWTWATPVTTVSGLYHLEGEEVAILSDGSIIPDTTVTNGTITLQHPATKITIGLPYECKLRTLSVTSADRLTDGMYKSPVAIAVRLLETRGLAVGTSFDDADLDDIANRYDEQWGEPINSRSDMPTAHINSTFDKDGYVYFKQKYPLQAGILGYVVAVDHGEL